MNREILFRGKEKTTGTWVHGSYTALQEDDTNNPFARNIPKTYHRIWQWEAVRYNVVGNRNVRNVRTQ